MANITERNGKYRIRVSVYDNNGKQHFKSKTYTPKEGLTEKQLKKEIQRQAILFEEEVKKPFSQIEASGDILLEPFMKDWFKNYVELKLKKTTTGSYYKTSKRVYELLGNKKLSELNPLTMQKFVGQLVNEGLSSNTVKNHVRLVSNVLNYGVKKQMIPYNPCTAVDYPREIKKEKEMFSIEEAKEFLSLLRKKITFEERPILAFFTLLIYTGARKAELLGLTWDDVDFENGLVDINKSCVYSSHHKEAYIDTTKTISSQRILKISDVPLEALEKLKAWHNRLEKPSKYIFVNYKGEILNQSSPNQFLTRFCKKYGFKKVNVHSFRHFAASAMIANGVDIASVQATLGHSTAATTISIYSHAFKGATAKASDTIVKVLE